SPRRCWRAASPARRGDRLRGPKACNHKSAFCKRGSVNVRFAPKATEVLRCREASLCATSGKENHTWASLASGYLLHCRRCPCAVEDRRIAFMRPVHSQHQDKLACRRGQPVTFLV